MSIPVISTGAISAAGSTVSAAWERIQRGESALSPLTLFNAQTDNVPLVGEVCFPIPEECFCRTEALALIAAEEALKGIDISGLRLGITLATTVGGLDHSEHFYEALIDNPALISRAPEEFSRHEPAALTGFLAKRFNAAGCHTLSTACSTAIHGIGMGAEMIRSGMYDLVLAVGTDALSLLTFRGFDSLLLIDYEGTRPFDKNRIGISLGEAAGAVLMASPETAANLNKPAKAYISGWGASADAYHMTAPHPEGAGALKAAETALLKAGISSSDIDWISAHGTGTPDNDKTELKAMKQLFDKLPPFSSLKGIIGHTLAASGAVETVYAIEAIKDQYIPGSVGFSTEDPEINASPSAGKKASVDHILKNSFGFGGNNGSLVISRSNTTCM